MSPRVTHWIVGTVLLVICSFIIYHFWVVNGYSVHRLLGDLNGQPQQCLTRLADNVSLNNRIAILKFPAKIPSSNDSLYFKYKFIGSEDNARLEIHFEDDLLFVFDRKNFWESDFIQSSVPINTHAGKAGTFTFSLVGDTIQSEVVLEQVFIANTKCLNALLNE